MLALWHVQQDKCLHREDVEAGATIDERLGDGYMVDRGCAQHRERIRADGGGGMIPRVKGEVGLRRGPAGQSPRVLGGDVNLAKLRLEVPI